MDFESLNNLYIIIAAKGASNVERYDGDLCVLDNDLDRGVKALYDNEQETIVAFLFPRGSYTQEKIQELTAAVEDAAHTIDKPPGA